jgi:hypothetical protein
MADVQALEQRWKHRWEDSKRALELAAIHVQQVERGNRPRDAYRQALETEIRAAVEYARVLRIYTDLVVHGKIPLEGQATNAARES